MSKHTRKPWKVDGAYACGKDIGSPSGVSIFEADCCGQIAGKDSDEIEANGRLIVAAPEMYELIEQVADLQNPRFDGAAYMELVEEMDRVADLAQDLLARIKGIEQDFASTSNGVSFLGQLLASLRNAVMFMEFTGKQDRPLTAEEQAWLEGAKTLLACGEKRE